MCWYSASNLALPFWYGSNAHCDSSSLCPGSLPIQIACPGTMTRCSKFSIFGCVTVAHHELPNFVEYLWSDGVVEARHSPGWEKIGFEESQKRKLWYKEKDVKIIKSVTAQFVNLDRLRRVSVKVRREMSLLKFFRVPELTGGGSIWTRSRLSQLFPASPFTMCQDIMCDRR